MGLHFLAFWPCVPSFPCILAFSGSASGAPPQVAKNGPFAQRPYSGFISAVPGSILQFLALWAFISLHFGLVGLHFLAFWPCGSSFPCVLAFWAFISFHFGLVGLHFLAFWPFRGQLLGSPPQVAKNGPFAQRPYSGFISAVPGSILQFFSLVGLHFLAFWPCGPSFPCILALWVFISLRFGPCGPSFPCILPLWASFPCILALSGSASGPPPQVAKNGPFAQRPYNGFISARIGSILQFFAFWAFISLHFGLVGLHFLAFWLLGLHFLAFWPCGPSFPCILALWAFISLHFGLFGVGFWPPPPQVAKNGPFAQRPYNGFIRAVTCSILQFLAFWAFISLHFGLVGLHFLAFWPCGSSFPCVLAFWAFISFHFGLVGLHFLAFWPFRGQLLGPPPQVAKNGPFAQRPYNGFSSAVTGPILQFFSLLGLYFLAFWPCGPSFPCILALWAFISLHFGLVSFHFLAFWPCGPSFPCILALWAFASLHFGFFGASGVLPTSFQKWPVCPTSLQWIYQRPDRLHFAVSSLLLWPCADAVAGTSCCFKWRSASPSRGAWGTPCAKSNLFL